MGAVAAGVTAAVAAVGEAFAGAGAFIAGGLGLGEATLGGVAAGSLIGTGLEGATIGALGGGALNAIEGKPILAGVGEGALIGGAVGGLGPAIGGALGGGALATTVGDVLAGAGAGALGGAAIPGAGGPAAGALGGATSGLVAGALGGLGESPAAVSPSAGGPGASAAGLAAPPGLGDANPFGNVVSDAAAPASYGATTGFGAPGGGDIYGGAGGATSGTSLTSFGASKEIPFTANFTGDSLAGSAVAPTYPAGSPGLGSELSPTDTAGLRSFITNNAPQGGVGLGDYVGTSITDSTTADASPVAGSVDWAGATSASTPATIAQAQAGAFPVPPVPPALDAAGNPVAGFPTLGDAQAAAANDAINTGGGVTPRSGLFGTSGGKLGYTINPAAGVDPSAPAGAGPGGSYTLAQGAAAGTSAPSGNSFSNLIHDPSLSNLGDFASKNAGLLLGAGTIGMDLLKGNQALPGENQLSGIANQLSSQATQLQGYLTSGTLPPGVHAALTQAGSAAKAAIKSQYASRGMAGSSAEAQDLASVDNTLVSQGATIATTLLNQGISEANLAAGLYGQIMNNALTQDNQLSSALATLAANAARPTLTVTPSGTLAQAS